MVTYSVTLIDMATPEEEKKAAEMRAQKEKQDKIDADKKAAEKK